LDQRKNSVGGFLELVSYARLQREGQKFPALDIHVQASYNSHYKPAEILPEPKPSIEFSNCHQMILTLIQPQAGNSSLLVFFLRRDYTGNSECKISSAPQHASSTKYGCLTHNNFLKCLNKIHPDSNSNPGDKLSLITKRS
jgi:hypothetical protein